MDDISLIIVTLVITVIGGLIVLIIWEKHKEYFYRIFKIPNYKKIDKLDDTDYKELFEETSKGIETEYKIEKFILEEIDGELTTKEGNLKLNKKTPNFDFYSFLQHSKCSYPQVQALLTPTAKIGFRLYISYLIAKKNNYNELVTLIESTAKTLDKNIKEWFDCFEYIDYYGDFEAIILPLTSKLYQYNINKYSKQTYTDLIHHFIKTKQKQANGLNVYSLYKLKIAIIIVGMKGKSWHSYFSPLAKSKIKGANFFILCGRGGYVKMIEQISKNVKKTFDDLEEDTHTTLSYDSLDDKLNKVNQLEYKASFLYNI